MQSTHTKVSTRTTVIKAIEAFIITHAETPNKAIIMANLGEEVMVMEEAITVAAVMVGPIIKAITITNSISIMVMTMNIK